VKIIFLKDLKRDICAGWAKVVDFDLKSCEGRGRKEGGVGQNYHFSKEIKYRK
jgi:hypothetical protein